jgi:tetratricopeptide (TPR) repeat protein
MKRGQKLTRLFWALSGKTLKEFARAADVRLGQLLRYELGQADPDPGELDRMAKAAGLTVTDGEQTLEFAEARSRPRLRVGRGVDDWLAGQISGLVSVFYERQLTLGQPVPLPRAEDRELAREPWTLLRDLPEGQAQSVVRAAPEFQSWALAELVCEESVLAASKDVERALDLADLAVEVAERVKGPEGFTRRLRGHALAHHANVLRVAGRLPEAEHTLGEAKKVWEAGSDPDGLLDPGRLLDLEASLRRDQRRFDEALALLDKAFALGRCKGRILINKGFTREAMGEYERAIETLLEAEPLVQQQDDSRLRYMLNFNLGVNACHLGRYAEGAERVQAVRALVTERGDQVELTRVTWLEGRIAAGQGRAEEALRLLAQARQEFETRKMWYDVALALLEEAVLLLVAGRAAEVKELAKGLAKVFEANGVHREALAALRLFHEAAEHEAATADLAQRVLRFLFRVRWDEGIRFGVWSKGRE